MLAYQAFPSIRILLPLSLSCTPYGSPYSEFARGGLIQHRHSPQPLRTRLNTSFSEWRTYANVSQESRENTFELLLEYVPTAASGTSIIVGLEHAI